ncbi:rhodanese-like domain-containing protein [Cellvibrio mixtus]|uniref:rhodanese-like domain-containing protein n=1 Tax=Cellvibrio mixtus TaxID=39650 RepID=UPI0005878CB2|nr:rhodanese-like domain-containing protein [Cellvibrio mixtus]
MLRPFLKLISTGLLLIMSTTGFANEIWIDVRTTDEFNAGHLEGAAHIPYEEIAARINEITTDKNATIHLYCRSGNRSGIAQQILQSVGFTNAINEGGYEDLLRKQAGQ